jgi:tRNA dimethylallyltransferase
MLHANIDKFAYMEMKPLANKYLIVIVGPTAVGKTDLCIQLAQRLQTEIVSADSRQVYQRMCIGTAQPTQEQLSLVKHHLVGCMPVEEMYSAGQFEKEALKIINRLFDDHSSVILTGGSGLYVQAVCEGLDTMPPSSMELRAHLNHRLLQEGLGVLVQELAVLDPVYYKKVDLQNPQRVIRALEVTMATGKPYSQLRGPHNPPTPRPFQIIKLGLCMERSLLYERINQRVDQMMNQGLLAEVLALYPYKQYNSLQTVGYQELFGYLDQQYTLQEAIDLIKRNTRRYAKRQLTWFRQQQDIRWFVPHEVELMLAHIATKMRRAYP